MSKQVTGEANETQICEALRRYSEREGFVREALFHLFSLTHVMEKPRPDILKVKPAKPNQVPQPTCSPFNSSSVLVSCDF